MSQNPLTNNCILVLQYIHCRNCSTIHEWHTRCHIDYLKKKFTNWTSENKEIDNLIQEMQLKINNYDDIVFEWIPHDQLIDIKKINNTIYSAIWKEGPLNYSTSNKYYERNSYTKVALKCLYTSNSENINEIIKMVWNFMNLI